MFYIKTPKQITKTGRKRILAVGTEVKKLGLDDGDDVIVYIMRPEDELSMDMLIQKTGSKFHLLIGNPNQCFPIAESSGLDDSRSTL